MDAFAQRVCVVTGATSGIGRALSLVLAAEGACVCAVGRRRERLDSLMADAGSRAGQIVPVLADLETDRGLDEAAHTILSRGAPVDVLVHCAGEIALGPIESIEPAAFDRLYRVNLRAPVVLTQRLLGALKQAKGQVVFVNSSAGLRASADNVLYAATKHGLKAFADGLREQVNADGIRVISVYLGRTATPMQLLVHEHERREYHPESLLRPDDAVEAIIAALCSARSGEVTDICLRPMRPPISG
jgi:NAD(P)-dependent dehydrogenase (short-subunit alcohol dehydrogenase family)